MWTRRSLRARIVPAVIALLALSATPALAADGAPIFTAGQQTGYSQFDSDVAGSVVVWKGFTWARDPGGGITMGPERVFAYDLAANGGASKVLPLYTPAPLDRVYQVLPEALFWQGKLYVVWHQLTADLNWNFDEDVWIWVGTVSADGTLTPDPTFPKPLVSGPGSLSGGDWTLQQYPSIGVTSVGGQDHVVVAWQDTRDYGTWDAGDAGPQWAPQIYLLDLTMNTAYRNADWATTGAAPAGTAVELTPPMARGQYFPTVGPTGIYWLDNRESVWTPGEDPFLDSAIWRASLATGSPVTGRFWHDVMRTYDNAAPLATGTGAAWSRRGPYDPTHMLTQLFSRSVGGTADELVPGRWTGDVDVFFQPGSARNVFAFAAAHNDSLTITDHDVFAYDSATGTRIPISTQHDPAQERLSVQMNAAIGPLPATAPSGQRVVFADDRDNPPGLDDSEARYQLWQAFVPTVSIRADRTSLRLGDTVNLRGGVAPDFAGARARLQRCSRRPVAGVMTWVAVGSIGADRTLSATSTARWSFRPRARGTFYLRVWFLGGTKYNSDGLSTDPGRPRFPTVPSGSRVVRIVVR